jgi:glycine oxidase
MQNYLIIGNGLIGRLTAWRLLVAGHKVSILSKDDWDGMDSAGYVAASMVSPATEAISAEPIVKTIGLQSYKLWSDWLKDLKQSLYYQTQGTLVVAHQGDRTEMERFHQRAQYVLEPEDFSVLNHQQLQQREPELADNFQQAILFEQESCLDNRHLYQQLADLLDEHCHFR